MKGWKWEEKGCRDFVRCLFHPTYVTVTANYSYDTANKLLSWSESELRASETHALKTVTNTFDYNGNQVGESIVNEGSPAAVENTFGYDYENRLTSAVMKGLKHYAFTYNGEGKRIMTTVSDVQRMPPHHHGGHHGLNRCGNPSTPPTVPAKAVTHRYDGSSLLMDMDAKNRVIASYSYGLGLTGITSPAMKGYYHGDALGSITEITGKEGNALRSYRYGAWGEMTRGETGHDINPFRYVGAYGVRWQDATLGMYHMGARWYQPGTGRFESRDPKYSCFSNTPSKSSYIYVEDNPINLVDPDGLEPIALTKILCKKGCSALYPGTTGTDCAERVACEAICNRLKGNSCNALFNLCNHISRHEPRRNAVRCMTLYNSICAGQ